MQIASRLWMPKPAIALVSGLLLIVILTGCDAGGVSEPTPSPTAPPPTATAEGGSALPLERFHYVASLTVRERRGDGEGNRVVISTEGDFQWPDRHAFTYTTKLGDGIIKRSAVIVGERAWLRFRDEPWREAPGDGDEVADLQAAAFSAIRPGFLGGPEFERVRDSVRRLDSTEETVNDTLTNHYRVGQSGREFFQALLADGQLHQSVEDASWELWLAKDGAWPVRLLASATIAADLTILDDLDLKAPTAWELRIDISRPNDPTLVVVVPEGAD
jgi:hypothetical protein